MNNCAVLLFMIASAATASVLKQQSKAESSARNADELKAKNESSHKNALQPRSRAELNSFNAGQQPTDVLDPINIVQPRSTTWCGFITHYFMIKNTNGLVLDTKGGKVSMQNPISSVTQSWSLELAGFGKFYIVNRGNGEVLDVEGGVRYCAPIITKPKNCGGDQQWFIHRDGHIIASVNQNQVLDVYHANNHTGNGLVVHYFHGRYNQVFEFEPVEPQFTN